MIIYPNVEEMKEKLWEIFMRKYEKVISNPRTNPYEKIFCNISIFPERHLRVKIKHSNGIKKIYTETDALEEKLIKVKEENELSYDQAYITESLQKSYESREKKHKNKYPSKIEIERTQVTHAPKKEWVPKQEKIGLLDFDTDMVTIPGNNVAIMDVLGKLIVTDDSFPDEHIDKQLSRLKQLEHQMYEMDKKIQDDLNKMKCEDKTCDKKDEETQTHTPVFVKEAHEFSINPDPKLITSEMFDKKRKVFVRVFKERMRDLQIAVLHGHEVLDFEVDSYSQCLQKINDLTMLCSRVNAKKVELKSDLG